MKMLKLHLKSALLSFTRNLISISVNAEVLNKSVSLKVTGGSREGYLKLQDILTKTYVSSCKAGTDSVNAIKLKSQVESDLAFDHDDAIATAATSIHNTKNSHMNDVKLKLTLDETLCAVSEESVLIVLQRYRSEWKHAFSYFNWASGQQGYSHGHDIYNEMLDILGRMKQIELMQQLFDAMPKTKVNDRTFAILLNRLASAHKVAEAIDLFYKRREYGLELDVTAFQILLMCLCRHKHVEEAEVLFLQKKSDFPYVTRSWNIILNGWCVLGNHHDAKRLWKDIISSGCEPDLFTYGTFINSLTKAGKLATALKLFDAMRMKGFHPDVVICNCIIDALCFKKKIPNALKLFDEMRDFGCLPNVATYNTIIKHTCKIGRIAKAYELLNEMESKGCLPNTISYTYFLKATKNVEEVSTVLEKMRTTGCKIDIDMYNLILNMYLRLNHHEGIPLLWAEMGRNEWGPDHRSYTVVIHGLYKKRRLDEALHYFLEMQEKGMIPEPRTLLLINDIEIKKAGRNPEDCENIQNSLRGGGGGGEY